MRLRIADSLPRPIAYVLGGGASYGAVQVGHLRALAEKTGDARLKALHDDGLAQALKAEGQFGQNSGTVADLMAVRLRVLETLAAARR